jgi:hypothetical protein
MSRVDSPLVTVKILKRREIPQICTSDDGSTVRRVGGLELALLASGYALGAIVYVGCAIALLRGVRAGARGLVALYWRERSRREMVDAVRRVKAVAAPPPRRSQRRAA